MIREEPTGTYLEANGARSPKGRRALLFFRAGTGGEEKEILERTGAAGV